MNLSKFPKRQHPVDRTFNDIYEVDICQHSRRRKGKHYLENTIIGYHYYKKTKDVATLMEIFGHSSEKITKRYIGINEDEISETLLNFRLGF